ncbi:MAG: hypothetical protein ACR2FV_13065 [Ornithinimicrobium sp.]|uniref:hypothetical protein n=1 Tax=Ornithinimicrobium sp. TaxID=1977084 RepID=UPI003D9B3972
MTATGTQARKMTGRRQPAPWVGLAVATALVVASLTVPKLLDWQVYARKDPEAFGTVEPLHGFWDPQWFGPGTLPALVIGLLAWRYAVPLAARLPWRWLLLTSYLVALAWMLSLALTDGRSGIAHVLANRVEYLDTALATDDVPQMLQEYISRIPYAHPDNWVTHVAGHPPGTLLFYVGLARLGLETSWSMGLVTTVLAASTSVGVLVTLRTLGAEDAARRAAPFLVLTPAAIFLCISADALFAATAAWGMAALAVAATARSRGRLVTSGIVAGLLLGACVMMSYGMPLLGILALAVLIAARGSWWPLPIAAAAALCVVLVFAAYGFAWWEAYPVLVERYWDGIASQRPGAYWLWGNLGALLLSGGLLLGSGVAMLIAGVRQWRVDRVVLLLAGAGLLMIAAADLSGMSRAEVERIWLPFIPWLTVSLALLPPAWRRPGLGLQILTALVIETLLYTSW